MKNQDSTVNISAVTAEGSVQHARADGSVVRPVRRIVTGHDDQGRSVFLSDGPTPNVFKSQHMPTVAQVVWAASRVPVRFSPHEEPAPQNKQFAIAPERGGVVFRYVDFAPDTEYGAAKMDQFMREVGGHDAHDKSNPRHFWFHKTATLDFGIVLEGEVWALMDVGERLMKPGDVIIQRATNHSWSNRSDKVCRMAFVLIDATSESLGARG